MDMLEKVEVRAEGGIIGGAIILAVAAVVIFQFAYPTISSAIASITDSTHATLAGLSLLALILVPVFAGLRMAGVL
jgi:hypothetical protein